MEEEYIEDINIFELVEELIYENQELRKKINEVEINEHTKRI